jgi:ubiquinone/menaquinone biosynthesis C-methylase UbiE
MLPDAMSDVWASVSGLEAETQTRLAEVLEACGADAQQQAMRRAFLELIDFPADARVLEVGCGSGVLTRRLAEWPAVGAVTGVDGAESLLSTARELAAGLANVSFRAADARSLPLDDEAFDVVVFDSTLSHVPRPEGAIAEAFRVLRPCGWLAAFDGDYATATVALGDNDPVQACVDAMMASSVTDRWLVRRLPALGQECGFAVTSFRSHGYIETAGGQYMLSVIDRGADLLCSRGQIAEDAAAALKREARRRVQTDTFFGHIAYASLVARKPTG